MDSYNLVVCILRAIWDSELDARVRNRTKKASHKNRLDQLRTHFFSYWKEHGIPREHSTSQTRYAKIVRVVKKWISGKLHRNYCSYWKEHGIPREDSSRGNIWAKQDVIKLRTSSSNGIAGNCKHIWFVEISKLPAKTRTRAVPAS